MDYGITTVKGINTYAHGSISVDEDDTEGNVEANFHLWMRVDRAAAFREELKNLISKYAHGEGETP